MHIHMGRIEEICNKKNWEFKILQKCISTTEAVVVLDEKSLDAIVKNLGHKNINKVPNLLDDLIFNPALINSDEINKQDLVKLIFVGHVTKKKGISDRSHEGQNTRLQRRYWRTAFAYHGDAGIENYSRYLDGRRPGEPPHTLLDYFPSDFVLFMDESHVATGQLHGMYLGDRSRKQTLVDYGFRLPAALDNRPLQFEEFETRVRQLVFVSATPGDYELRQSGGVVVEQVVRPTGLVDRSVLF